MRKTILVFLACVLIFSMTACGGEPSASTDAPPSSEASSPTSGQNNQTTPVSPSISEIPTQPPISTEPIVWKEPKLEAAVRLYIEKPSGGISPADLVGIEKFWLDKNGCQFNYETVGETAPEDWLNVYDLSDLKYFPNLCEFQNYIVTTDFDFGSISGLSRVTLMSIAPSDWNAIIDITPLSKMAQLTELSVIAMVVDPSPFAKLINLQSLSLPRNINDLSFVSGMTELISLDINRSDVTDLSPLSGLLNLERVHLWNTPVTDLEPLRNLPALREVGAPQGLWRLSAPVSHVKIRFGNTTDDKTALLPEGWDPIFDESIGHPTPQGVALTDAPRPAKVFRRGQEIYYTWVYPKAKYNDKAHLAREFPPLPSDCYYVFEGDWKDGNYIGLSASVQALLGQPSVSVQELKDKYFGEFLSVDGSAVVAKVKISDTESPPHIWVVAEFSADGPEDDSITEVIIKWVKE